MTHVQAALSIGTAAIVCSNAAGQSAVPKAGNNGRDREATLSSIDTEWEFVDSPSGPTSPPFRAVLGVLSPNAADFDSFNGSARTSGTLIAESGIICSYSGANAPPSIVPGFGLGYDYSRYQNNAVVGPLDGHAGAVGIDAILDRRNWSDFARHQGDARWEP